MRTDVKVGFICLFVLVLGVVGIFAWSNHQNKNQTTETGGPTVPALTPERNSPTPGGSLAPPEVATAPAPSIASGSSSAGPTILGPSSAYGSPSSLGGPLILPPGAATAPGSGGTPSLVINGPATTTPGYTGPSLIGPGTTSAPATGPGSMVAEEPVPRPGSLIGSDFTHSPSLGTLSITGSSTTYTIQKGDTFGKLAKANHLTIKAIQEANRGVDSSHLKIGQKITLPAAGSDSSTVSHPVTTTRPGSTVRSSTSSTSSGSSSLIGTSYTVKRGDTLHKIAKAAYGTESKWRLIWRANRQQIEDPDDLELGTVLKIPAQ